MEFSECCRSCLRFVVEFDTSKRVEIFDLPSVRDLFVYRAIVRKGEGETLS